MSRIRKLVLGHTETIHKFRPALKNQVYILLRIWRNYDHHDIGVERFIRLFLASVQFLSLGLYIKHLFGFAGYQSRRLATETYVLFKVIFPALVLSAQLHDRWWIAGLTIYLLAETVVYLAGLIFLADATRETIAPKRSLTLLFLNFFELVLEFAVLYAYIDVSRPGSFNNPIGGGYEAVYFSFVTAATVGYGDIIPLSDLSRQVAILQITLTFIFVGLFLNYFASLLQGMRYHENHVQYRKTRHAKKTGRT